MKLTVVRLLYLKEYENLKSDIVIDRFNSLQFWTKASITRR